MKKIILFFSLVLSYTLTHSQTTFNWAKQVGGVGNDKAKTIVVDALGNVYNAGGFSGNVDMDPGLGTFTLTSLGAEDIFISKLDAAGNFIWAKQIGGSQQNYISSIVLDAANNIYATGYFNGTVDFDPGAGISNLSSNGNSDAFILKLDANGNFLWANSTGGTGNDYGIDITTDPSGNIYTCGSYTGTVDFDPSAATLNQSSNGMQDVFISKSDGNGLLTWAKSIGGSSFDLSRSIAVDVTGNVVVTGYHAGVSDLDPGPASYTLSSLGYDAFILKLDQAGNFIFAKQFDNIYSSSGNMSSALTLDASGNIYTAGNFSGAADMDPGAGNFILSCSGGLSVGASNTFISKLDANGNFVWAKKITGTNASYDLALDPLNNVFIVGYFTGTCDFDPAVAVYNLSAVGSSSTVQGNSDIYILKLDSTGNFIWAYAMGGSSEDAATAVTVDANGTIYSCGYFDGNAADFDPGINVFPFSTIGNKDIFIQKMAQTTLGIKEFTFLNKITVFPNPTKENLTIELNEVAFDKLTGEINIEIYNALGQKLSQEILIAKRSGINTASLTKGSYVVRIINNETVIATQKIIKE
ncbi:MAG: T9SS type A sorting domain-containing protein [Bacteroidetes bacterium]|nr:T9SS type A sorting domain-containing protein [Bacteroidota bacterium]